MNATTTKRRLCFPDGTRLTGVKVLKGRAACHCGFVTTPRVSIERAEKALEVEHGFTVDAPNSCAHCRWQSDTDRPWDVFMPWNNGAREVWVCWDYRACWAREDAAYAACYVSPTGAGHFLFGVGLGGKDVAK